MGSLTGALALAAALLMALPAAAEAASPGPAGPPAVLSAMAPVSTSPLFDPFDYSDTLLLGNNNSQASRNLTSYFQSQRGVPDVNVLFADLPTGETISGAQWDTFAAWFSAELANRSLGPGINYIVTFKGMPVRVAWSHPGNNGPSSFQDALMLLGGSYQGYIGTANLWSNPFFNRTDRFSFAAYGFRLVTGIYAYNESTAMGLIDKAAASLGSRGEFVLDTDWSKGYANSSGASAWGSYQYANSALVWADGILRGRGEATYLDYNNTYVVDRTGVMGYSSWGSNDCCDGAVTVNSVPRNSWVDGAIAETFVSTGGRTFTWPPTYGQSLIADWIDEGVSGIKGYTDEPYINAIADGHILFDRYTRGYNLAESFWSASHVVGWRQLVIGDPKMAPYADVGDLSINSSASSWSPTAVQFTNMSVAVAIENAAAVASQADLRVTLPGGAQHFVTVALAPFARSVFQVEVDLGLVPSTLWGPQTIDFRVDSNGTVREWDDGNNDMSAPVEVQRRPVVSLALESSSVPTNTSTALWVNATRADRPISTIMWREDAGPWNQATAAGNATSVALLYARSGAHTYEAYVVDAAGIESAVAGAAALTVTNRAPTAAASANATTPLSLEPVEFRSQGSSDADGRIETIEWDAGPFGLGGGSTFTLVFLRPGQYTVVLTVTDDEGATASASVEVSVQNRPPQAAAMATPREAPTGVGFLVDAAASFDPDGEVVGFAFEFDGYPVVTGAESSAVQAFPAPGVAGAWVTVTDDWGATSRIRVSLLVLDRPPLLEWSLATPASVIEGDPVSATVTASDPDSNLLSYSVDFGDGARSDFSLSGRTATFSISHRYSFEGNYTLSLAVADVEGNLTLLVAAVVVVHPAPEAPSFGFASDGRNLTVDFTTDSPYADLLTLIVSIDGSTWRTAPARTDGRRTFSLEGLDPGNHSVRFELTDGVKTTEVGAGTVWVASPASPGPVEDPGQAQVSAPPWPLLVVGFATAAGAAVTLYLMWRRRRGRAPPAPKGPGAT